MTFMYVPCAVREKILKHFFKMGRVLILIMLQDITELEINEFQSV